MKLVADDRAVIMGLIRQEFLSGIKELHKYDGLKEALKSFPDLPLKTEIFEMAATMYNDCRRKGVSASTVDMTICATAKYYGLQIWSDDPDYLHYKKCVEVDLYAFA